MCKDDLIAGEDVGSFLLVLGNKVGTLLSRPPSSDASAEPTIDSAFSHLSLNPYKRLGQMGHFPRTKQMSAGSLTPSASLATGSLLWMLPITPGLQTNAQRSTWLYKAQADLAASETQGSVLMPSGEETISLKVTLSASGFTPGDKKEFGPVTPELLNSIVSYLWCTPHL
mmetsp:Transcript_25690/g.63526  ORF Transcript_25690/g.63526 Transcript_25690/m.63526 type:complete len:170 (+) Transcript_25690:702-1211(+)